MMWALADVAMVSIDAGGGHSAGANYVLDGSIGGVGAIAAAPTETLKGGYVGQLTEVTNLVVISTPATINEAATSQLSGTAQLDDGTITLLSGSDINWLGATYPIASITGNGLLTASLVFDDASGPLTGYYLGATAGTTVQVLDSDPDNFGNYAGDGLPDFWQTQYFGLNNPAAAPGVDADGDGQDNLFEYAAGVVPTNAASVFALRIEPIAGQPHQQKLIFTPRFAGRIYTPEYRTNLMTGGYQPLTGVSTSDNGLERTVTDVNANEPQRFYRIKIDYP